MNARILTIICLLTCCVSLAQTQQDSSPNPAKQVIMEDFEASDFPGWIPTGSAKVAVEGSSKALILTGQGYGEWTKARSQNFTLRFRYRHAEGTGNVVLQSNGEPPDQQEYHIRFTGSSAAVIRRAMRTPKELGKADLGLQPGKWHVITISLRDGEIKVTSGKTTELTVNDPQPLPAGLICFGCIDGSGFAYDDIVFTPEKASPAGKKPELLAATPIQLTKVLPPTARKADPDEIQKAAQSKSYYRKQHGFSRNYTIESEDPITPVLIHAIERYLNGASDVSEIDIKTREAIARHPEMTEQNLRKIVNAWKAIPAKDRERTTPVELRNLNPAVKVNMTALRTAIQRSIDREPVTPMMSHQAAGSGIVRASSILANGKAVTLKGSVARTGPAFRYVPGMGPVPVVTEPMSPHIDELRPVDMEKQPYINPGKPLTIVCSNLPSVPWNLGICKVHFYPETATTPAASVKPYAVEENRLMVIGPTLPAGRYDVQVEMNYSSGPVLSNKAFLRIGMALNPVAPVLQSIQPAAQFPGMKLTITGDKFTQDPPVAVYFEPVEPGFPSPGGILATYVSSNKLEVPLPENMRPGRYRLSLSAGGSPSSKSMEFTVAAPKYKVEFTTVRCDDESSPEDLGNDEIATYWVISADGEIWSKNTGTYSNFQDGTERQYYPQDSCVYAIDGSMRQVKNYLIVNTQVLEIDAGEAKEAAQYIGLAADFAGLIGDCFPGIGSLIGTIVKYVLKAVAWLVEAFGGAPDLIGSDEMVWTYEDLQYKTNNPNKSFGGEIVFKNHDDIGSYTLKYRVTRANIP